MMLYYNLYFQKKKTSKFGSGLKVRCHSGLTYAFYPEISSFFNFRHSEQRKAALSDFVVWATTVGINHQSVEIAYSEDMDGFGLTSANYTSIGSDLLQVPRKAILSWDHARKSSFLK